VNRDECPGIATQTSSSRPKRRRSLAQRASAGKEQTGGAKPWRGDIKALKE